MVSVTRKHAANLSLLLMIFGFGAGCAGTPARSGQSGDSTEVSTIETSSQASTQTPAFESTLRTIEDKEVAEYLGRLAARLVGRPTRAKLLVGTAGSRWQSFAAPGPRLYLSTAMLKASRYESEVAAALAFELGFLERGIQHVPGATITTEHRLVACEEAIGMLYSAGIDPRGLTALLEIYERAPGTSPIPIDELEELKETARAAIARQAPLMNPVVRSAEFTVIRKRLERL